MTREYAFPSWDTAPRNVEEAIRSVEAVIAWEQMIGEPIPLHWGIVLTNHLMLDIMQRIKELEDVWND